ncbi:hypothetical protein BLOT_007114 [Blomia tropicalis]|nr:hypothetical protein BLOT_007114 [Blomia tropicalis]
MYSQRNIRFAIIEWIIFSYPECNSLVFKHRTPQGQADYDQILMKHLDAHTTTLADTLYFSLFLILRLRFVCRQQLQQKRNVKRNKLFLR